MKNEYSDIPVINGVSDLEELIQPYYTIEPYFVSDEVYEEFFTKMYNIIKGCFEKKECREFPVKFKFYYDSKEVYTVQLRHFITNLILWKPFVLINDIKFLNEKYIMDGNKIIMEPEYDLDNWINFKIISVLRDNNVKERSISTAIANVIDKLNAISIDFSLIMNLNFSYMTFKQMYDKYPRIKEIMECHFTPDMEPRDIEIAIDGMLKEEIEYYKNEPNNPIGVILKARSGIKEKQFAEFTIAQGLKPTLDGKIMTTPIENSTLIRGLDRPSYLYIDGSAARKSLILNKTVMGKAGYFGRMALQLARSLELSRTVDDCNTKHFVKITPMNKKQLKKLDRRYYKVDENDDFELLDGNKDKHLIGKTIYLRSPVTCALGDKVCAKCFGRTAGLNYDIAEGVSGFESEEMTKELEQKILSSKHLLTTKSEVLKFNAEFDKFFSLNSGEIYPVVDENEEVDDIEDWAIYIAPDTIEKADEMDEDSDYNTYIKGGVFYVVNLKDSSTNMIPIQCENEGKQIFLTDETIELRKKSRGYIKFKDLTDDTKLFEMDILNNELTKPLYDMMALLDKGKGSGDPQTIDEMCQKFLELLDISGIAASSLSGEVIINRLIRSISRPYSRPDFTKDRLEPYTIITIRKALEHNASPTLGLSVQYTKRQMMSDALVTDRTGTSYVDPFMKPQVSNLYKKYGKNRVVKERVSADY